MQNTEKEDGERRNLGGVTREKKNVGKCLKIFFPNLRLILEELEERHFQTVQILN